MGSEEGQGFDDERSRHEVTLAAFRISVHEVTNRDLRLLVPNHQGNDDVPAVNIDWHVAYAYAAWLGGRLPTKAEWEYAARAGCLHAYCDRDGKETTLDKVGWYAKNSGMELHPVMQLEPNLWGLFDMHGNAWEWVGDWFGGYSGDSQVDPWGPPSGEVRVFRGGGYGDSAQDARAALRYGVNPEDEIDFLGFRVVLPGAPSP